MLDAMSARARPRRRHGARMRMCSTQPRFSPKRSLSSWLMNARTWPAIWSPSQAIRQRDRSDDSIGSVTNQSKSASVGSV